MCIALATEAWLQEAPGVGGGAKVVYRPVLGKEVELPPAALTRGNRLFSKVIVGLPARAPETSGHGQGGPVGLHLRVFHRCRGQGLCMTKAQNFPVQT